MVDVTDRADVAMRLSAFELFLGHSQLLLVQAALLGQHGRGGVDRLGVVGVPHLLLGRDGRAGSHGRVVLGPRDVVDLGHLGGPKLGRVGGQVGQGVGEVLDVPRRDVGRGPVERLVGNQLGLGRLVHKQILGVDEVQRLGGVVGVKLVGEQLVQALGDVGQVRVGLGAVGVLDKHLVHQGRRLHHGLARQNVRDLLLHRHHHGGQPHQRAVQVGVDLGHHLAHHVGLSGHHGVDELDGAVGRGGGDQDGGLAGGGAARGLIDDAVLGGPLLLARGRVHGRALGGGDSQHAQKDEGDGAAGGRGGGGRG